MSHVKNQREKRLSKKSVKIRRDMEFGTNVLLAVRTSIVTKWYVSGVYDVFVIIRYNDHLLPSDRKKGKIPIQRHEMSCTTRKP